MSKKKPGRQSPVAGSQPIPTPQTGDRRPASGDSAPWPKFTRPEPPKPTKRTQTDEEKLLAEAKDRFRLCQEAEQSQREVALDDLKFRMGEQWPQAIKAARDQDRRPCLTINVLPARERQILNDQRQNRQAIKVSPLDDQADVETAEIIQGIMRHIEYDSNADVAWDTAFASAVRGGFGYVRVLTEFESPDSFDQVIKIKRVRNAFTIYMDPAAQEPDYSDARYGFAFTYMGKDDYKREYPDSEFSALDDWATVGDRNPGWMSADDHIRIAEYYWKSAEEKTLCLLRNGSTEIKDSNKTYAEGEIQDERKTTVEKIEWIKFNGAEILDETEWPGKWIPIVPVLGDELDVDGKRVLEGMVRHAKDPQRMQNYMASAEVEAIALAPRAPFVAAEGQTEDFPEWSEANTRNFSVLRYKAIDVGGTAVPPPARNVAEPPVAAITNARLHFADDLKAVTGIYDAQLGARSNETSGKAILGRQKQGEISNFHYSDNLTRSVRHAARIILDLLPKIYDTPRVMRIIAEDGSHDTAQINQKFVEQGVEKIYDLTVGRYDVAVSAGPSYQTKRQQAAESMIQMTQAYPQLMQVAGDLLVKNLDWPGAEELAERLKKMLPPQLQDHGQEIPPQAQAMVAQAKQEAMQLNAFCKQLEGQIQQLQFEKQAKVTELQGRSDIERMKIEAQLASAEVTTKMQSLQERLTLVGDLIKQFHAQAHDIGMQKDQQAHVAQQADQAQQAQQAQLVASSQSPVASQGPNGTGDRQPATGD